MKKPFNNITFRSVGLFLSLLLLHTVGFVAQAQDFYTSSAHSTGGHWQVSTDAQALRTTIQFFDAGQTMIYQETLPGEYIKLSERTVRLLDSTLYRLVNNRLVTNQLKKYSLVGSQSMGNAKFNVAPFEQPSAVARSVEEVERGIQCDISPEGKLGIRFKNPFGKQIAIQLTNESDFVVYQEMVSQPTYTRRLSLKELPNGHYLLSFSYKKQKMAFGLVIENQANQPVSYQIREVL